MRFEAEGEEEALIHRSAPHALEEAAVEGRQVSAGRDVTEEVAPDHRLG
nr:hypothetical protein [Belnapia mucosa]